MFNLLEIKKNSAVIVILLIVHFVDVRVCFVAFLFFFFVLANFLNLNRPFDHMCNLLLLVDVIVFINVRVSFIEIFTWFVHTNIRLIIADHEKRILLRINILLLLTIVRVSLIWIVIFTVVIVFLFCHYHWCFLLRYICLIVVLHRVIHLNVFGFSQIHNFI